MKDVICAGIFVVLLAAVIGASGTNTDSFYSGGYKDVFCGNALPMMPPAETTAVRPAHNGPVTVDVSIVDFAFNPSNLTINVGEKRAETRV